MVQWRKEKWGIFVKTILLTHAQRYPAMEPRDAVKLIYQNEFGGGHLIRNEEAALTYLRREYEAVGKDNAQPLTENIGSGLIRVNLAALPEERLEKLGQAFLQSAKLHRGTRESFLQKLTLLEALAKEGTFGFSAGEMEAYLYTYAQEGYPMVSHSEIYRKLYHPAYRVVQEALFH